MSCRRIIRLASSMLLMVAFGCSSEPRDAAIDPAADAAPSGPPAWILASLVQPRGLVKSDPGAGDEYLLFSQLTSDTEYLIDRAGRVVHSWKGEYATGSSYLMDNGDLLRGVRMAEPPNFRAGGVGGYLQRLSWDGEVLWHWQLGDEQRMAHHDIEPLPNGNVLVLAWERISPEQAAAAGRRPELTNQQGLWSDWIAEVEPLAPNDARIVWEWHVWDHLVQNHDPQAPNHGDPTAHPHRLDVNADASAPTIDEEELARLKALGYMPADATIQDAGSDYLHANSLDYHAGLDQILVSLPEIGEIWIIDHSTTTAQARSSAGGRSGRGGDLLYRWGNPQNYGRGNVESKQLFYQHQVEWVPEGFPGAGNITLFNNGSGRPDGDWSSIVELTPPLEKDGSYPLAAGEPWGPAAPSWRYLAEERGNFFAPFISGVRKLETGHLLVCSGPQGRFFEVTPQREIVWEYLNPFHGEVPGWNPPGTEDVPYGSFRAIPVPPDHPGLAGRRLAPLDPQPTPYVPPPRSAPE